jgi:hypothetical protein
MVFFAMSVLPWWAARPGWREIAPVKRRLDGFGRYSRKYQNSLHDDFGRNINCLERHDVRSGTTPMKKACPPARSKRANFAGIKQSPVQSADGAALWPGLKIQAGS